MECLFADIINLLAKPFATDALLHLHCSQLFEVIPETAPTIIIYIFISTIKSNLCNSIQFLCSGFRDHCSI